MKSSSEWKQVSRPYSVYYQQKYLGLLLALTCRLNMSLESCNMWKLKSIITYYKIHTSHNYVCPNTSLKLCSYLHLHMYRVIVFIHILSSITHAKFIIKREIRFFQAWNVIIFKGWFQWIGIVTFSLHANKQTPSV